jgi:hypothetical protein
MMRLKKFHSASLVIILLTTLVILGKIFFDADPFPSQEYKFYDWMSRLRKRPTASPVVILAIDDKSIRSIGSWPWPRSYIAGMIEQLSDYGAHTMGISLLYPSREVNPGLAEIQGIKERWHEIPLKAKQSSVAIIETVLTEAEKKLDHDTQLISAVPMPTFSGFHLSMSSTKKYRPNFSARRSSCSASRPKSGHRPLKRRLRPRLPLWTSKPVRWKI